MILVRGVIVAIAVRVTIVVRPVIAIVRTIVWIVVRIVREVAVVVRGVVVMIMTVRMTGTNAGVRGAPARHGGGSRYLSCLP